MKILLKLVLLLSISLFAQENLKRDLKSDSTHKAKIDSILQRDTAIFKHSEKDSIKTKSLSPLKQYPLSQNYYFFSNEQIKRIDNRNSQDLLSQLPFVYIYDLGQPIQFSTGAFYGTLPNNSMILEDGIPIHNGIFNDLNFLQSESIDSIESIPITKGFFYGNYKNYAAANIITKEQVYSLPYSKIKFYQGPNEEGYIDGIFNFFLSKRINTFFEISNRKVTTLYKNNKGSIWNGKLKLKYFLSEEVNLIGSYSYSDLKTDYNGGVALDSIPISQSNSILYDAKLAPVNFESRHFNNRQHRFYLKSLYFPNEKSRTEFSVYSNFNRDVIDGDTLLFTNDIQTYGAALNSSYDLSYSRLKAYANYESGKYTYLFPAVNADYINTSLSFGLGADFYFLDSLINISPLAKLENYKFNTRTSTYPFAGLDLGIKLNRNISACISYGYTNSERNFLNDLVGENLSLFETSININYPELKGLLKYFNKFIGKSSPNIDKQNLAILNNMVLFDSNDGLSGIDLILNANPGKLSFENHLTYYNNRNKQLVNLPEYQIQSGIFYKDSLFNSNLDLKAGFIAKYIGAAKYLLQRGSAERKSVSINPAFTLDFTLAGEIQKSAIIYFTIENILNKNYYLIPYYPMRTAGYRFGFNWEIFN